MNGAPDPGRRGKRELFFVVDGHAGDLLAGRIHRVGFEGSSFAVGRDDDASVDDLFAAHLVGHGQSMIADFRVHS